MKITIIGAGAMGCVYAALLAEASHDITVVDVWGEHIEAIRQTGLKITGASGDRVVSGIRAELSTGKLPTCDLIIIATKASGVGDASGAARSLMNDKTLILTIQNGLGAGERIREFIQTDNILLGVAGGFGASIQAPGHAHHSGMQLIRIGEIDGGLSDRVEQLVAVWQGAGFNVKAFEDINQLIWEKFVCNVTFSGSCTLFDMTLGEVMADADAWKIAVNCAREAYAAGRAHGVHFDFDDVDSYVRDFGEKMPDAKPSMLQDHLACRRSEIDAINAKVSEFSARYGLDSPYNDVVTAIIRSKESRF